MKLGNIIIFVGRADTPIFPPEVGERVMLGGVVGGLGEVKMMMKQVWDFAQNTYIGKIPLVGGHPRTPKSGGRKLTSSIYG